MNDPKNNFINALTDRIGFPSPTGVNYYESEAKVGWANDISFRPQQGLTIMNSYLQTPDKHYLKKQNAWQNYFL